MLLFGGVRRRRRAAAARLLPPGHPGVVDRLLLLSSRLQTSPPDAVLHGRLGVAIPRPLPVS
jgi:hypothetical protein